MKKLIILLGIFISNFTHANYYCIGKVTHFGVGGTQDVKTLNISNSFGVHRLCDISDSMCQFWATTAMEAKTKSRTLVIYYQNPSIFGDQSNGECLSIGDWVTPEDAPYYVQLH